MRSELQQLTKCSVPKLLQPLVLRNLHQLLGLKLRLESLILKFGLSHFSNLRILGQDS